VQAVALSIATLILPLVLGAIAGSARAFREPDAAIDALNRFALQLAFPALVVVGLSDPGSPLAREPAFLGIVPGALALTLLVVRAGTALAPGLRAQSGTIALVVSFGNTAYLGLPYVDAILGREALATAAIAVAIHVALAMTVGPLLLARWSEGGSSHVTMAALLRQPLLLSPLVGLAVRALPVEALTPLRAVLDPLGRTAAPVSMVLLGLYLHTHRARVRADKSVAAHVAARILVAPAVTLGLVVLARSAGALGLLEARVLVVLAAMPAAITTFALALEQGIGPERVAATIVASTLASAVTLPLFTWLALALG
jgi:predicted permease